MKRGRALAVSAALATCVLGAGCHDSSAQDDKQPVVVRVQYPPKGPVFIEGALTDLRLVARDGSTKAKKQAATTVPVLLGSVDPGHYTLRADVRPCDANCGNLDPAAYRCRGPIVVPEAGDARVIVTLRANRCDVDQQLNE